MKISVDVTINLLNLSVKGIAKNILFEMKIIYARICKIYFYCSVSINIYSIDRSFRYNYKTQVKLSDKNY